MNFKFVYKICTKSEWQKIKDKGQLIGKNWEPSSFKVISNSSQILDKSSEEYK